jgi:two-component system chemotaxis sensor kinase CheA
MTATDAKTADRDPETVALFVEESLEGLQRVERMLLDAERGEPAADLVPTIFREIHTIKGTSGFLDLARIQALSHATEDLLAGLRDGTITARAWHYGCLMEAGDRLRRLVEDVRRDGAEGEDDVAPLIARLSARGDGAPAHAADAIAEANDAAPPAAGTNVDESGAADGSVRVAVGVLDDLMDLIGELVLARNQVLQLVDVGADGALGQAACHRLSAVTSELQAQVMKTRMQPVARVFDKVPRLVRDLMKMTGKQVTTQVTGTGTEIDRALVEMLRDPIMHIVRNAVDHGIEAPAERAASGKAPTGRISVRAWHDSGVVTLEIEDDGRGMDPTLLRRHAVTREVLSAREAEALTDREALELVFRPGFSTASSVSAISGRGVGMDVVRTHVERAGGRVEIDSTPGVGTSIRLKVPLTLAIIPALLVSAGGQRFAIPHASLLELLYLDDRRTLEDVRGVPVHRLRGDLLPLVRLGDILKLPAVDVVGAGTNVVVVAAGDQRYGLVVDEIHDTEEIVVKSIAGSLKRLLCYAGAAVLGDGGLALIVDVSGIATRAGLDVTTPRRPTAHEGEDERERPQAAIVFRAGADVQCLVPASMVKRLERISMSAIERVGNTEVVQYGDAVLPIVRPEHVVPIGAARADGAQQSLIVFEFGRPIAMAVDEIVDIIDLPAAARASGEDLPFTLGQTVVLHRTTLILDVYRILRELAPQALVDRRRTSRSLRVLVADDRAATRGALAGYLRSLGIDVLEAEGVDATLRELRVARAERFDAVVADPAMEQARGLELFATLQRERPALPAFAWAEGGDDETARRVLTSGAKACISNLRREDLIAAFEKQGLGFRRSEDRRAA